MTDFIDRTCDREQFLFDVMMANRPHVEGVSATHCVHCAIEIPEARRLAAPGCTLCIECAE